MPSTPTLTLPLAQTFKPGCVIRIDLVGPFAGAFRPESLAPLSSPCFPSTAHNIFKPAPVQNILCRFQLIGSQTGRLKLKTKKDLEMPVRRTNGLVVKELQNELLIYDLERDKAHCLNHACRLVWDKCDGKATVAEVASLLENEGVSVADEAVVQYALSQLKTAHLLSDCLRTTEQPARVSRREVMGRIGVAAAVSLPLITSILAPTAQAQASCLPNGSACTSDAQCCSGRCQPTGQSQVCAG